MQEIDKLDRKILLELDCDSRQPISRLAKKLKQARDTVEYRVQRLTERGIIRRFTTIVNPARLGLTRYNTYLRLAADRGERQRLMNTLLKTNSAYWIAECAGQWDVVFALAVKNDREFFAAHTALLSEFSSIVLESAVHTIVDVWVCAKDYLLNAPSGRHIYFGGDLEAQDVDQLDQRLLSMLIENARHPVVELAERLKLSAHATANRIERLEKRGVIAGYRIDVDLDRLNKQHFKAQLFFNRFTKETEQVFRDFCLGHPNITYYLLEIGPCPLEIEIEVKSYARYHEILDELRSLSPGMVRNIHTILIRRAQLSWCPQE